MEPIRPSIEAELRALANSTQSQYLPLVSSAILALLFIFYARNFIRFGEDLPAWSYAIGGMLILTNIIILALSALNRIPERYSQLAGVILLLMHGFANYTNLAAGVATGIYASAFTVLALSMCVLSIPYFLATLALYMIGWLIAVNITQQASEWLPTLILIQIVACVSYLTLRQRLQALKRHLILERRVLELESYLPICANCNSVREKGGDWQTLEDYLETSEGKKLSHGVCPTCKDELYGDYFANREKDREKQSTDSAKPYP